MFLVYLVYVCWFMHLVRVGCGLVVYCLNLKNMIFLSICM